MYRFKMKLLKVSGRLLKIYRWLNLFLVICFTRGMWLLNARKEINKL